MDKRFTRATAAFVFSHDQHKGLSNAEMMRVAKLGRAVSPVTSYLAIEPGVRPSRAGIERSISGFGVVDLEVFERRDVAGDGVAESKAAFFVEHHERDAGDRFGHGVDAEDVVFAHGRILFEVGHAECFVVDDLAFARDHGDRTGDAPCIDVGLDLFGDAFEPLGRNAYPCGPGLPQVARECRPRQHGD